jgi:hypothetical protein
MTTVNRTYVSEPRSSSVRTCDDCGGKTADVVSPGHHGAHLQVATCTHIRLFNCRNEPIEECPGCAETKRCC